MKVQTRYVETPVPSLFIGYVPTPYPVEEALKVKDLDYLRVQQHMKDVCRKPLPDGVLITEHQTAGVACHHHDLMGVFFELPWQLRQFCVDDCVGAIGAASWEELREFEENLKLRGVKMSGAGYSVFEEGIRGGIDPESAWDLVKDQNIWIAHDTEEQLFKNPYKSVAEVRKAIEVGVEQFISSGDELSRIIGCVRWIVAVIIYDNCD